MIDKATRDAIHELEHQRHELVGIEALATDEKTQKVLLLLGTLLQGTQDDLQVIQYAAAIEMFNHFLNERVLDSCSTCLEFKHRLAKELIKTFSEFEERSKG